jgi:hypothetical protein
VTHHCKSTSITVLFAALLMPLINTVARDNGDPKKDPSQTPVLEIRLRDLGYQPTQEHHYPGTGIPRDLSILNDDSKKRLAFINDKLLAVYFSHLPVTENGGAAESRSMEALFVDPSSGSLVLRRTWATRKRKWVNGRWDTQARILPVRDGFLVHAGNSLILYSADQQEKARVSLDEPFSWAALVAVLGRTVHLQRITEGNTADARWLTSDTLKQLETQKEVPGVTSASDHAVVTKLAHCAQLQAVGEPTRDLCCYDPCRLGLPEFLSDKEILSVFPNGFVVLSDHGEKLWGREITVTGNRIIANHIRSLEGNRFAIAVSSDRNIVFDQMQIAKGHPTVLVYDRSSRTHIFALSHGPVAEPFEFAFSPAGNILAVLVGDAVRLYKIPSS